MTHQIFITNGLLALLFWLFNNVTKFGTNISNQPKSSLNIKKFTFLNDIPVNDKCIFLNPITTDEIKNYILSLTPMRMAFIAMAQSIYSYGIGSWGGAYNIQLNSLETTINSLIKISFKNPIGCALTEFGKRNPINVGIKMAVELNIDVGLFKIFSLYKKMRLELHSSHSISVSVEKTWFYNLFIFKTKFVKNKKILFMIN
ncbi:hypothetical protein AGLY_006475 [Aphis glycines]|uniref:Uncharacterized protein n=1 Tax=Aphis glycines TaxID=307491 RepID=A0A6G0TRQ5_APHGL|nr:hypothetical protein AGLY_006475 [Aphis glycines]